MAKPILRFMVTALLMTFAGQAMAWHDKTPVALARAADYGRWFTAAGADMTRAKAGDTEGSNHDFNPLQGEPVTVERVLAQGAARLKAIQDYAAGK